MERNRTESNEAADMRRNGRARRGTGRKGSGRAEERVWEGCSLDYLLWKATQEVLLLNVLSILDDEGEGRHIVTRENERKGELREKRRFREGRKVQLQTNLGGMKVAWDNLYWELDTLWTISWNSLTHKMNEREGILLHWKLDKGLVEETLNQRFSNGGSRVICNMWRRGEAVNRLLLLNNIT